VESVEGPTVREIQLKTAEGTVCRRLLGFAGSNAAVLGKSVSFEEAINSEAVWLLATYATAPCVLLVGSLPLLQDKEHVYDPPLKVLCIRRIRDAHHMAGNGLNKAKRGSMHMAENLKEVQSTMWLQNYGAVKWISVSMGHLYQL
jgi:hypothetical protein